MSPLLTVVTVCMNDADGLRRTLASLAAQTADRALWEAVVVDGGSHDESVAVARSFAASLPVRVASEPDDGIYDAMNKGFRRAAAPWVQYLNAGDTYASDDSLQILCAALAATDRRWLVARTAFLLPDGAVGSVSTNVPHRRWRHALGLSMHAHPSTVMRRDLLEELDGFETQAFGSAADFDVVLRAGLVAGDPANLDVVVAHFAPGGVSAQQVERVPRLLHEIRRRRLRLGLLGGIAESAYAHVFERRWRAQLARSRG
jgi:glycosyltransferase involved in cell wall biosynthesis